MRRFNYLLSLVMIGAMPWMDMVHLPGMGTLSRVLGLAAAGFWFLTVFITGKARKPNLFHLAMLLFVLWLSATVVWSRDVDRSWDRIFIFMRMLGLSLMIWDLYESQTMVRNALQAYIVGAYIHAGSVVYNYLMGAESVYGRFAGVGNIANTTAYVLGVTIPLAWYLAAAPQIRGAGRRFWQWVNFAYFPTALIAIAFTATRFGILMAVPACLYGLVVLLRARGKLSIFILIILIGALWFLSTFVPASSLQRLAETGDSIRSGDLTGRVSLWRTARGLWEEHPFIGIGINAFPSVNRTGQVVHNTYLVVLVETGIVGLALYLPILLFIFITAWRLPGWESLFWLTLLFVWGMASMVLNLVEDKSIWLFFSLLLANARALGVNQPTEASAWGVTSTNNKSALPLSYA